MNRKALIVWGGWDGHQPREVAEIFRELLAKENFDVEVSDTLDAFLDAENGDYKGTAGAFFIGVVAGIVVIWAIDALEYLRIDDPIGAVPVHLVAGIWWPQSVYGVLTVSPWRSTLDR